ncbi:MAG: 4Fe-4S binding protein [Bdellovibrio sp.]|nr:4Fe-4S binding protein [Bdellovibrio sp.]
MKRKIVKIDEELCNGCGDCVTDCSEGALQIINGKAKLIREDFCDGFGDCMGACPTGAIIIEERETVAFDKDATKQHLMDSIGPDAVLRMEEAQKRHEHGNIRKDSPHGILMHGGGCPGSQMRQFDRTSNNHVSSQEGHRPSQLAQWPVQIHLVSPQAPFFNQRELVVLNTCAGIASANIHKDYIKNRSVTVGCPKLDDTSRYAEKLASILRNPTIPKVIVTIMEVPCCYGLSMIVQQARAMTGRKDLVVEEHTLSLSGERKTVKVL